MKLYHDDREFIERPFLNQRKTEVYLRLFKDDYNLAISKKRKPLMQENRQLLNELKAGVPKNKRKKLQARLESNRRQLKRDDHQYIKDNLYTAMLRIVEAIICQQQKWIKQGNDQINLHRIDVSEGTYCLFTNNAKLRRIIGHLDLSTSYRKLERLKLIGFVTDRQTFGHNDFKLFISLKFLPFLEYGEPLSAFTFPALADGGARVPGGKYCKVQGIVTLKSNIIKPLKADKESRQGRDGLRTLAGKGNTLMEHPDDGKNSTAIGKHLRRFLDKNGATIPINTKKMEQGGRGAPAADPELDRLKVARFHRFWDRMLKMLYPGVDLNEQMLSELQPQLYHRYFSWITDEKTLDHYYLTYIDALQHQKNYVKARENRFTKWPRQFFAAPRTGLGKKAFHELDLSTFHGHLRAIQNNRERDRERRQMSRRYQQEKHFKKLTDRFFERRDMPTYVEISRKVERMGPEFTEKFNQMIARV